MWSVSSSARVILGGAVAMTAGAAALLGAGPAAPTGRSSCSRPRSASGWGWWCPAGLSLVVAGLGAGIRSDAP